MTDTAMPIKYAYDPDSPESRFMQRYVFGKWRSMTELFGIAVMLLFLYFIVKIAMREYGEFFMQLHPALMEIAIDVTLDAEGVHSTSKHWAQFVAWRTVHKVIKTPQGIGLRLDNQHFIPILADELPDGLSADDVLDKIENWRGRKD